MSKKSGKAMKNLPNNYINAMQELQLENEKLRAKIYELENGESDIKCDCCNKGLSDKSRLCMSCATNEFN